MIASIVNHAWWAAASPSARRFRRALVDPASAQARILRRIIRANEHTAFGKEHGFASILSQEDFARKVPVRSYDEFTPWIDRVARGEQGVLTAEAVARLVPSSGSTRARKLIPFTRTLKREFNAAIGPWIDALFREQPTLARGPAYWSITPAIKHAQVGPIPIGFEDDREYLGGVLATLVGKAMAVRPEVPRLERLDEFRYATLLSLLRTPNLRLVSVWHPSFWSLLLDELATNWESLLADVASGECSRAGENDHTWLTALPMPRRAKKLAATRPDEIARIWPDLCVVSCWADAGAASPAHALLDRCQGVTLQPKGLLATEGVVSIPVRDKHPLAVASHFLEFLDDQGSVRLAHQLNEGETYEVLLTTSGGLYRYRLGDLVRVNGIVNRTPSIRFVGRCDGVCDLVGEKLNEAFVGSALERWCSLTSMRPTFAMFAPTSRKSPCQYALFVTGDHAPESAAEKLDTLLRANPHYDWARQCGQLAQARVRIVDQNAYERYAAALVARGMRLGDIKPTRLSARDDWESVLIPHDAESQGRASGPTAPPHGLT